MEPELCVFSVVKCCSKYFLVSVIERNLIKLKENNTIHVDVDTRSIEQRLFFKKPREAVQSQLKLQKNSNSRDRYPSV